MKQRWVVYSEPLDDDRPLHPRHGTHDPIVGSPLRQACSVRRTLTIDMLRPRGVTGELRLRGAARDLVTASDGSATIAGTASMNVEVAYLEGRVVRSFESEPPLEGAADLSGVPTLSGFRRALRGVWKEPLTKSSDRSLLYQLADDVPVATLVSGYATTSAGLQLSGDDRRLLQQTDVCAGWRDGGTIVTELERTGRVASSTGPVAPSLLRADDPLAWHEMKPLLPNSVRRHRRIDVIAGDPLVVDAMFRDSHYSFAGRETCVHEYEIHATVERSSMTISNIDAVPRSLPWTECPAAADSAKRLRGLAVAGLRDHVRKDFTGTSTCTHLNDTLRSMEGVAFLVGLLPEGSGPVVPVGP